MGLESGRMTRPAFWILLMASAACKSTGDFNWLEREKLRFMAENEEVRSKDLQREYDKYKARSDELNGDVMALSKEREKLYAQYDKLKADIAKLKARSQQSSVEFQARGKELSELRKKVGRLAAELEKERKRYDDLNKQIQDLAARKRALEAKKKGGSKPPE